jgi:hypothetical protein
MVRIKNSYLFLVLVAISISVPLIAITLFLRVTRMISSGCLERKIKEGIEPEAREGFVKMMQQESPAAVVTFNKSVFNLVSAEPVGKYIGRLKAGEVICSQVRDVEREVPIYLTYPTGWRYDSDFREFRKRSLELVKDLILRNYL